MGAPGWPELACCTASIARVRIVLIESVSSCCPVAKTCSLATMRFRSSRWRFYWQGYPQLIRAFECRKGSYVQKVYQFPEARGCGLQKNWRGREMSYFKSRR